MYDRNSIVLYTEELVDKVKEYVSDSISAAQTNEFSTIKTNSILQNNTNNAITLSSGNDGIYLDVWQNQIQGTPDSFLHVGYNEIIIDSPDITMDANVTVFGGLSVQGTDGVHVNTTYHGNNRSLAMYYTGDDPTISYTHNSADRSYLYIVNNNVGMTISDYNKDITPTAIGEISLGNSVYYYDKVYASEQYGGILRIKNIDPDKIDGFNYYSNGTAHYMPNESPSVFPTINVYRGLSIYDDYVDQGYIHYVTAGVNASAHSFESFTVNPSTWVWKNEGSVVIEGDMIYSPTASGLKLGMNGCPVSDIQYVKSTNNGTDTYSNLINDVKTIYSRLLPDKILLEESSGNIECFIPKNEFDLTLSKGGVGFYNDSGVTTISLTSPGAHSDITTAFYDLYIYTEDDACIKLGYVDTNNSYTGSTVSNLYIRNTAGTQSNGKYPIIDMVSDYLSFKANAFTLPSTLTLSQDQRNTIFTTTASDGFKFINGSSECYISGDELRLINGSAPGSSVVISTINDLKIDTNGYLDISSGDLITFAIGSENLTLDYDQSNAYWSIAPSGGQLHINGSLLVSNNGATLDSNELTLAPKTINGVSSICTTINGLNIYSEACSDINIGLLHGNDIYNASTVNKLYIKDTDGTQSNGLYPAIDMVALVLDLRSRVVALETALTSANAEIERLTSSNS